MEYKVINDDCLNALNYISPNSQDIIITSPPYNMTKRRGGYADSGRYDVYKDWKCVDEYLEWTKNIFDLIDVILKPKKIVAYNFSYSIENPSMPYKLISYIENNTNFILIDTIIWKKANGTPFPANQYRLSRNWEYVFILTRKKDRDNFDIHKGITNIGKNKQKYYNVYYNYIEAPNNNSSTPKINQATYSTQLVDYILKIYANTGYSVCDIFNGTGTTGASALKNKMRYVGFEISPQQVEYTKERLNKIKK